MSDYDVRVTLIVGADPKKAIEERIKEIFNERSPEITVTSVTAKVRHPKAKEKAL